MERGLRELSVEQFWVLIKSCSEVELVANASPIFIGQSAGEGHFTVASDREKLGPILQSALLRKLRFLLETHDLVGYRVLLNMQTSLLRGFQSHAVHDLVPGFEPEHGLEQNAAFQSAQHFLYQNGFESVNQVDSGGWTPVHYAALRGDPLVLQGLLQRRANINRWTWKDHPQSGLPFGATPTNICSYFKHHQALRLLISARAKIDASIHPDVAAAAAADDPEGIRILCASGGRLFKQNLLGSGPERVHKHERLRFACLLLGCQLHLQLPLGDALSENTSAPRRHRLRVCCWTSQPGCAGGAHHTSRRQSAAQPPFQSPVLLC